MKGSNKRGPRPAKTHTWCNRRLEGTEALELNRSRIREEGFPGPYISLHTKTGQGSGNAKRLEPVWMGQFRVLEDGTYRWEPVRGSRDACERGDGDGVYRSHRG